MASTVVIQPLPGIGDMIWHLPAIRSIAATTPGGKVDLLINAKVPAESLLANEGLIDAYLRVPRADRFRDRVSTVWLMVRLLRRGRYQRAIILHHSPRYALAARLAGIPEVLGFGFRQQKYFLTQKMAMPDADRRIFQLHRNARLLEMLGIPVDSTPPHLAPEPAAMSAIQAAYGPIGKPWVGFGIGATEPYRRWAPENFAAVADRLDDAGYPGIFLLGAPHETPIAQAIIAHCQRAKPIAVTDRPLDQTIALIARCALFFANDSGLMNVAAALGLPSYALVGHVPPYDHSPHIRNITPPDGPDRVQGVARIDVANALAVLDRDGILTRSAEP